MSRNHTPSFLRRGLRCALAAAVLFSSTVAYAGDFIDKRYREYFLSPELQKKFYMIEVQTNRFFDRQHSGVSGLVESFRGTSVYSYDLFTRWFVKGKGGMLDAQSFTYDGAVAIMSYLVAGQTRKAANMLKVYRREFYTVKNGMIGLYNSYRTDKSARPGLALGMDGDRIHLGPTTWVALAALHYTAMTGDLQFLSLVIDMAKWAQRLDHFTFSDGERGAPCMGYGWGPDWSGIYSTENVLDYYVVLVMLKDIYDTTDDKVRNIFHHKNYGPEDIDHEMKGTLRWLLEIAYDPENQCFNCGYNQNGVDRIRALDTITWGIPAITPETLHANGIDPFELVAFLERNFIVTHMVEGERIKGADFTNSSGRRKPIKMVWIEGTGQLVVMYQVMSRYAEKRGRGSLAEKYRQRAIFYSDEMDRVSELCGMIDKALPYATKRPNEKEIVVTFMDEWEIPRGHKGQWVASVSSTAWRYFALAGFNPLAFDRETVQYRLFSEHGDK